MNIFVGNLPFSATEEEVAGLFADYGTIDQVRLITDRDTGRPRGFGFVEIDDESGRKAIEALDGTEMGGRALKINEAKERQPRSRRW